MTLEKAVEILNINVLLSPKATEFKEAVEVIKSALRSKKIEFHLDEAFRKECEYEIKQAGSEAVKAFAETLKAKFDDLSRAHLYGKTYYLVGKTLVDNLVNELYGNPKQLKGE